MSEIDINNVLQQMRTLQAGASQTPDVPAADASQAAERPDFGSLLKGAIDQVNEASQHAGELQKAFHKAPEETNLTEVMIASEKAGLAFDAMKEGRNRLVSAYQEIKNMKV